MLNHDSFRLAAKAKSGPTKDEVVVLVLSRLLAERSDLGNIVEDYCTEVMDEVETKPGREIDPSTLYDAVKTVRKLLFAALKEIRNDFSGK